MNGNEEIPSQLDDLNGDMRADELARGFGDDVLMVGNSCGIGALKGAWVDTPSGEDWFRITKK